MLTGNVTGCPLIKSRCLAYTPSGSVNQRLIQLGGKRGGNSIIGENNGLPLVLHVERFFLPATRRETTAARGKHCGEHTHAAAKKDGERPVEPRLLFRILADRRQLDHGVLSGLVHSCDTLGASYILDLT